MIERGSGDSQLLRQRTGCNVADHYLELIDLANHLLCMLYQVVGMPMSSR